MLDAQGLTLRRSGRALVDGVSLRAVAGELLAIIGPNGAGKSTLLSMLSGAVRPNEGEVKLDGRALSQWPLQALARRRAVLAQSSRVAFSFTCLEVALLGRIPHGDSDGDPHAIELAENYLSTVGLSGFSHRRAETLSGGERQRLHLARALVQLDGPGLLLLDEPTSAQDLRHQHEVLRLARGLADAGFAVVAVLHDLDLAAQYAHRAALLADGGLLGCDTPDQLFDAPLLTRAYGLPLQVFPHPLTGHPSVLPIRSPA